MLLSVLKNGLFFFIFLFFLQKLNKFIESESLLLLSRFQTTN